MKPFRLLFAFIPAVLLFGTGSFCHSNATSQERLISLRDTLPNPVGYVNDFEGIFTREEEQILDSLIGAFERSTTIQIAVITLDTTMVSPGNFEKKTLEFLRTWGVGQKETNNGIVIGLSRSLRRVRIENGYGIEKILSNDETKQIIDTWFIPHYRDGDYFGGTRTGLKELMTILEKRYQ